jgi:hypothetical protein
MGFVRASTFGPTLAALFVSRVALAEVCARPTDPTGYAGYAYAPEVARSFDTPKVRVWYALSGKHAVRPESTRGDGVPNDVARVGEVTEDALTRYAAMGYRPPVSDGDGACGSNGGDDRLDVYLLHFAAADGTTATERCATVGTATQCASFILAEANFTGRYKTVDEGIRTVLPHEVFHAIQNAYDAALDRFWAEGTAQWITKELDPSLQDLERFLPAFFREEDRSIDAPPGGVTAGYLYGAAIWPVFLSQRYEAAIVREIFERASSGTSALEAARAVLDQRQSSLEIAWSTFWAWNASTANRADPGGYPNAAAYPLLATRDLGGVATGITSGSTAIVYRMTPTARVSVRLESTGVHAASLLPLEEGRAVLAKSAPLPATTDREALIVLTSLTTSKADAPYTLRVEPAPDESPAPPPEAGGEPTAARSGGGCALGRTPPERASAFAAFAAAWVLVRRRSPKASTCRGGEAR